MAGLDLVHQLSAAGRISAAATVSQPGAAVAVARMCFGNHLGFEFEPENETDLFSPQIAALLLAVDDTATAARLEAAGARRLGSTLADPVLRCRSAVLPLPDALAAWQKTLEKIFPTQADLEQPAIILPTAKNRVRAPHQASARIARPRVFIPVFPGTNCEYDSARAFERAGAEPDILVVRNLTPEDKIGRAHV